MGRTTEEHGWTQIQECFGVGKDRTCMVVRIPAIASSSRFYAFVCRCKRGSIEPFRLMISYCRRPRDVSRGGRRERRGKPGREEGMIRFLRFRVGRHFRVFPILAFNADSVNVSYISIAGRLNILFLFPLCALCGLCVSSFPLTRFKTVCCVHRGCSSRG